MQIVLLKVVCCERIVQKCKCLWIRENELIFSKMKIHLQPMNVKGRYCLSIDDFECS